MDDSVSSVAAVGVSDATCLFGRESTSTAPMGSGPKGRATTSLCFACSLSCRSSALALAQKSASPSALVGTSAHPESRKSPKAGMLSDRDETRALDDDQQPSDAPTLRSLSTPGSSLPALAPLLRQRYCAYPRGSTANAITAYCSAAAASTSAWNTSW